MKQSKILHGGLRSLSRALVGEAWRDARYTILLDENTFALCLPQLINTVEPLQEAEFIEVPAGEDCKSLEVAVQVWQTLLEGGADRSHVLVCLGGGSLCDLGGFLAAGYKRGIRHINIPTTLLAMADAAIGGKTAVDFGGVKNSIGFFYPADLTVIDHVFCDSLDPVQMCCGEVEMVKTAAVADPALFQALMASNPTSAIVKSALKEVVDIKTRVVKDDPYDHGIRRILNFGHTFGHAIETHASLPHGLSVGIGMKAAMYLSVKKLGLSEEVYRSYSQWFDRETSHLDLHLPSFNLKDIEQMLPLMHQDKKNADGELRCVLLQEPGAAVIDITVSDNEVRDAMLRLGKSL